MPNGDAVCTFSLAVDRVWTKGTERSKETTWFRVTTFGKQAELANKWLAKGRAVLVEGRLAVDPKTGGPKIYTNKEGGAAASFEIVANLVRFIEKPPAASGPSSDEIDF